VNHDFISAKHAAAFSGTFECRSCGLDAPAVVRARGSGSAKGVSENSAHVAAEIAEADANAVAARTLTFYPCPKCGKVDPSSRSFRIQVIIGSLVLGAAVGLVAFLWFRPAFGRDASVERIAAASVGAVVAIALYFWWGRAWWRVKKRVEVDMSRATFTPRDDD
jgi:predicted RNA-binding Zn-ribbon protein involved in translation (DUF1610 family)